MAIAKPMPRLAPVIMATLFMNINGKVALITGAAKRIGREIALEFARRGARVAVHYRSGEAEAKQVAGRDGAVFHADLRDAAAVEKMFRGIEATFGGLDILINSASVFSPSTADDATRDHWDLQMDTNAKAPFFLAQYAARLMRARGAGKIVNIADVAVSSPWLEYLPYSVAKGGVVTLTRGLAKALAPQVQVNAIAPGPILPPPGLRAAERRKAAEKTLLKRWGSPRDIAAAVLFFLEGSDFVTGVVLPVDGGRLLA